MKSLNILSILFVYLVISCQQPSRDIEQDQPVKKIPVIIDTDANNEVDDQHALAYLFLNDDIFNIRGVTVNATFNGGEIKGHLDEAQRVMHLLNVKGKYPLHAGANDNFSVIQHQLDSSSFDGQPAVDFIIKEARQSTDTLVLLPVGKLTNIALAIKKAPDIKEHIRIVWLGSNYPEKGEYNQENDTIALNYLLNQEVAFEIVTVRYGKPSGSDVVKATPGDIDQYLKGKGPKVSPIEGRHGGFFETFGDYSVNLFEHIGLYGDPPSRALFDMVAVAILKNPQWGKKTQLSAPILINDQWVNRPQNQRKIILWENFDKEAILMDFYHSFEK